MRKLLNILAVIIGLAAGVAAVAGAALFVIPIARYVAEIGPKPEGLTMIYPLVLGGGVAFLCGVIASRALLHLRKPGAATARDMIGTAVYLIVALSVFPLFKSSAWSLPLILGTYFFHRFLVRRVTAQTFPPSVSHS
jgi:hypothetical protein